MKNNSKYFNESLVSTWIFQLILVIEYIHSMNIIHRDMKPQNIFVDRDMNLKIGDFGVSKLLDGTENCQTMKGTPLYISPELSRNDKYTKKTDIWSLGCVIFEICTLEVLFKPLRDPSIPSPASWPSSKLFRLRSPRTSHLCTPLTSTSSSKRC